MPQGARRSALALLLLFAVLAVIQTWPLAAHPARLSRNDNADTVLNEWTLAWVAHAAARQPARLFDANIFYPDGDTLAYSEALLVPAAMGAPLLWLGASPVVVYNLLLIAGLALTGWSACLLLRRWTGDAAAGIVCGTIAAFNAHTLTRLPHLQAMHVEFLPPALLALDTLLRAPSIRRAIATAGWFALQALTSIYLLVFAATALVVGALARPEDWCGRDRARRLAPYAALAGATAAVLVIPALIPYRRIGIVRTLDETARYSAVWQNYLATPARVHYAAWSRRFFGGTALFPGVTALLLTAAAVVSGVAFRDRRARMALAFGAAGVALSFGPAMPGYALLYRFVPLLRGIRAAARFGYLAILASAILAGFGLAMLRRLRETRRWAPAIAAAAILCANADAFVAPITYSAPERISPVYARLADDPGAVLVEIPLYPPDRVAHGAQYLLNATKHWKPMLNGYSGLVPPSYVAHYEQMRGFPDADALDALARLGVTHIVVHDDDTRKWLGTAALEAVRHSPRLRLEMEDGDVKIYRLVT